MSSEAGTELFLSWVSISCLRKVYRGYAGAACRNGAIFYLSASAEMVLLFVMFFDWFVQRMEILESTNLRRLLTGMCCGYALGQFYVWVLLKGFYYVYGLVGGRI